MKYGKKITAAVAAALIGAAGALPAVSMSASAAEPAVTVAPSQPADGLAFEASRSGDVITVTFKDTTGSLDHAGLVFTHEYDESSLEFDTSFTGNFANHEYDPAHSKGKHFVFTGSAKDYAEANATDESTLASLSYSVINGFEESTDYSVTYNFLEAYSDSFEDRSWADQSFTVTYREDPETVYCDVTFVSNGVEYDKKTVESGEKVSAPAAPTREDYSFDGWYLDSEEYEFDTAVTQDITLDAKWTKDTAAGSKTVDLSNVRISKTLNKDDSVSLNEEFTFKLEYVSMTPAESSAQITAGPDLGTVTITNSGSIDLTAADFEIGGVYKYKVTEVKGSTSGMEYDSSEYYLELEIEENASGDLILDKVVVTDEDGTKTDLSFENSYAPTDTLTVSKTVVGEGDNPYDKNKKFSFSITFTAPAVTNGQNVKVKVGGAEQDLVYGKAYEFTLGNGDEIEFTNIPEGAAYSLTESGEEYYTASAVIKYGSTQDKESGEYAEDFTVGATIVDGGNSAEITNTYSITPPTGLKVSHEMLMIIGAILLALAGGAVIDRKLRKAED